MKNLATPLLVIPVLILLQAAACMHVPADPLSQSTAPAAAGAWQARNKGEVLYARDGSPVSPTQPGAVIETSGPVGHPLEEAGGSRLVLLDLYQIAVDERDEMSLELEALGHAMTEERARYAELERRFQENEALARRLQEESEQLEVQNLDLAGRLTTAQIRRLEAEKLLLESTLEAQRLAGTDR